MVHNSAGAMQITYNIGDNAYATNDEKIILQQEDRILFNASKSNSAYGNSSTVQPAACTIKFLIKY